jgi:hypothetical protein
MGGDQCVQSGLSTLVYLILAMTYLDDMMLI